MQQIGWTIYETKHIKKIQHYLDSCNKGYIS
jgi:hypothetical protein